MSENPERKKKIVKKLVKKPKAQQEVAHEEDDKLIDKPQEQIYEKKDSQVIDFQDLENVSKVEQANLQLDLNFEDENDVQIENVQEGIQEKNLSPSDQDDMIGNLERMLANLQNNQAFDDVNLEEIEKMINPQHPKKRASQVQGYLNPNFNGRLNFPRDAELDQQPDFDYGLQTFSENPQTQKCWAKFVGALHRMLIVPFKGIEYILDAGQKSNKLFLRKLMVKKEPNSKQKEEKIRQKENSYHMYIIQKCGFSFQYALMPLIILFSSGLCILNLVLWSYYRIGYLEYPSLYVYLTITDWMVATLFSLELVFNLITSEDLDEMFDFENVLLCIIIFDIGFQNTNSESNSFLFFLHSLRSLRMSKLRSITKLFGYYINRYVLSLKVDDLKIDEPYQMEDEDEEMMKFLVEQLINFISGILIEASLLLAIDRSLDYTGYHPFNHQDSSRFDYLNASYFVVITFSTIGYGDIYPIRRESRLFQDLLIIVNITIMGNILTGLIRQIFSLSPHNTSYDFKDHVVVIGNMDSDELNDFLEELVENDNVERSIDLMQQLTTGIKCIVVVEKEPTSNQQVMAEYLSDKHENEIVFLKENVFSQKTRWQIKANLPEARILFAFGTDHIDENRSYSSDQQMSITAKNIKTQYPFLRVHLVLNTHFKKQIDNDSYFDDLEVISKRQMNEFIMASSLENPGLSTTLQHLFTMKDKNISPEILRVAQNDQFLQAYIRDMQCEIYQYHIPDFFVGMSFRKFAQILYLYNMDPNLEGINDKKLIPHQKMTDNRQTTLIAIETIQDENFQSMNEFSISEEDQKLQPNGPKPNELVQSPAKVNRFIFDMQTYADQSKSQYSKNAIYPLNESPLQTKKQQSNSIFQKNVIGRLSSSIDSPGARQVSNLSNFGSRKQYKTQMLINPQNYNIRKNDIAYVICRDYDAVRAIQKMGNNKGPELKQFQYNFDLIKGNIANHKERQQLIKDLFSQLGQKDVNQSSGKVTRVISNQKLKPLQRYFDLRELKTIPIDLKDHIVIFGQLQHLFNILFVLRKYSGRKVIIYSQQDLNLKSWIGICKFSEDVYYFKGEYLNLEHLKLLSLATSHQALIRTELVDTEGFPDSIGLCIARILLDYLDYNSFLIELKDISKVNFLYQNPLLKHLGCPSFLQLSFMQGNVHFSNTPLSVLSRVVQNESWIRLFKDLVVPKIYEKRVLNQALNCLKLTKEIQDTFKYYGVLQFALLESNPSCIAISLIKQKIGSKYQELKVQNLLKREHVKVILRDFKKVENWENKIKGQKYDKAETKNKFQEYLSHTLGRVIGHRFVLSNPQFYTPIEEGDFIIIIGNLSQQSDQDQLISVADNRFFQKPTTHENQFAKKESSIELRQKIINQLKERIERLKALSKYSSLLGLY